MRNLAVVPARSGSLGLKNKNIKLLCGKPLLAYTIEAAKESKLFDEIFVSTDSEEYAIISKRWGANIPFLRSKGLSTDTASSWDVVIEAIKKYQEMGQEFNTVALLQPTSPLRTAEDIIAGYNKMKELDANTIIAVCEVDHSPLWSNILPENLSLNNFLNRKVLGIPRQNLPVYYRINGALYVVKTKHLMDGNNIYAGKSFAIVMPKMHSIDIDDEMDFIIAEALVQHFNRSL